MTDLRRAARLFHEARRLPPEARNKFLGAQCAGDTALRSEVESLLRAADEPVALTQMLDASVGRGVASMAGEVANGALTAAARHAAARQRPDRIGQFTITSVIARGGMGAVYEARQQRPPRTVALKVLTREFATDSARRRFEYEAQLLGQLRHPGIAQIYEAGLWEEGDEPLPYFAMELVAGALSITRYAARHDLRQRRRLDHFAEACDAV
ncbi:MAG: protein kinase, partial [Phycisphaerales bacterium JB039]